MPKCSMLTFNQRSPAAFAPRPLIQDDDFSRVLEEGLKSGRSFKLSNVGGSSSLEHDTRRAVARPHTARTPLPSSFHPPTAVPSTPAADAYKFPVQTTKTLLPTTAAPALARGPCKFFAAGFCKMGESCLYKHSGMQTTATDSAFDQLPASLAAWLNGVDTLQQHQRPTATSVPAVAAWSSHPPPPRAYTTKAASVAGTRQESEKKTKANEAAAAKGNLAAAAAEAEEAAATKAAAAAEAAAAKEAAAARDAEAAAAATTCGVCTEPHNIRDCVRCPGGHAVCKTCFEDQIGSQTGVEDRDSFIRNGCSIICEFCKPNKVLFRERDFISLVSDDAFQLLTRARDEVTEVRTERRLQAEFEARIERVRQELGRGQEAHAQNVSRHRLHIAENILTLKCPRAQCRRAFLDYTGCMALTCSCGCNFCAWCLQDCANDAHPHVKACPHSQSPGSYHGTFDQFQTVHRNRARLAAQQYLTAVPPGELADVRAAIAADLAALKIVL